jgi:hypothetical protein
MDTSLTPLKLADVPVRALLDVATTDPQASSAIAAALTARPVDVGQLAPFCDHTVDRLSKTRWAESLLDKLESHLAALRGRVDFQSPRAKHLQRAIVDGDEQAMCELGINTSYGWLDDLVSAMARGTPFVEIETVGPYAGHHLGADDELDVTFSNLPSDERAGILLAAVLRDLTSACKNIRFVSLLDDLNNHVSNRPFTNAEQERYILAMSRMLYEQGTLRADDVPGRDYVLIRESEQVQRIDELVERLRHSGSGQIETSLDGDVSFRPCDHLVKKLALRSGSRRLELRKRGILLKRLGRPTCQALDAAIFLEPVNRDIVHFVLLDQRFESEQDKTYALIRAVDITTQERYHNIFYDSDALPAELIVYAICELLRSEVLRLTRLWSQLHEWEELKPDVYATVNYARDILSEDRRIVAHVIEQLERTGIAAGSALSAADVGAGPNLYPSMLLAPYVRHDGVIELVEPTDACRTYLAQVLYGDHDSAAWSRFQELMSTHGGQRYHGVLERLRRVARIMPGSVLQLPVGAYDLVTSFFVSESITTSRMEFRRCLRSLAGSLKPDGLLIAAHMVGSDGWHTGPDTRFPAVKLVMEDLEAAYRDADLTFTMFSPGEGSSDRAREGYRGMAVAVARRLG